MDMKKGIRQHLEMDNFFTGGFVVKGQNSHELTRMNTNKKTNNKLVQIRENSWPKDKIRGKNEEAARQAATELEKIADEVHQCRKCDLGSLRTNAVPGEGKPNARIVFVGEGPGANEDAQGRPFVGRAGQLLDRVIIAMGLKRSDVFICNILKCRPPENRDPRAEEIINCFPYLQRQIEIINPEIIVALGAPAARTLLNTNKSIGQLRGQFQQYYAGLGRPPIKLMPTYHTAYLLRNYSKENRQRVWEDMKKVLAELGLPIPKRAGK